MCLATSLLWIGNVISFLGGVVLALETVAREREVRKIHKVARMFEAPELTKLKYEVNGIVISDERDLEIAHLRVSKRRAYWGLAMLITGFVLVVIAELIKP